VKKGKKGEKREKVIGLTPSLKALEKEESANSFLPGSYRGKRKRM